MVSLLLTIPESTVGRSILVKKAKDHVVESFADNLDSFIATDAAFSRVDDYGDYDKANDELIKLVEEKFDDIGIPYDSADVLRALEDYDVTDGLDSYFKSSFNDDDRTWNAPTVQEIDEIDDLFERT